MDLYNPLDESMTTLNSDVIDYLVGKIEGMHLGKQVILTIKSGTPVNEERVLAAFRNMALEKEEQLKRQKHLNVLNQLRLFIIGVAFITAAILFSESINPVLTELISIVGSFSIWEAANIWIVGRPEIHLKKLLLYHLTSTKIVFRNSD